MSEDRAAKRARSAKRKRKRELTRKRKAAFDDRVNKKLGITDGVIYDGAVLAMLIVRNMLTETSAGNKAKITEAITKYLRDEAHGPKEFVTPFRCPRCGHLIVEHDPTTSSYP